MFCQNCGNKLESGDLFCRKCGTRSNAVAQVVQQPAMNPVQQYPAVKPPLNKGAIILACVFGGGIIIFYVIYFILVFLLAFAGY